MRLILNDHPVEQSLESGQTVGSLLDMLRRQGAIGDDEVVVGLQVDRRACAGRDLARLESLRLAGVGELAVTTAGMRGYARRILVDATDMLPVLKGATLRVARLLRGPSQDEANGHLFNLLNALQRFLACLSHVQNACALDNGPAAGPPTALSALSDALDAIETSQQSQDWPGLAVHLERRLVSALDGLGGVVENMEGELRDAC